MKKTLLVALITLFTLSKVEAKELDRTKYYLTTSSKLNFSQTVSKVKEELKKEGFSIANEMNIKDTFKKKMNVDFSEYIIIGACHGKTAYNALSAEENLGVMLPCNFIVRENKDGLVEVSSINPSVSMNSIKNEKLMTLAKDIQHKIENVITSIE